MMTKYSCVLFEKNLKYGNSALDPVRIFSDAPEDEQILVRIDDKLSRLINSDGSDDEDVIFDLWGYATIYLVLEHLKEKENHEREESK
jgi:hypothetical protein